MCRMLLIGEHVWWMFTSEVSPSGPFVVSLCSVFLSNFVKQKARVYACTMALLSHVWSFLPFGLSFATDLGDAVEKFHIGFVQCRFVAPLPRHSWSLVITPPTPSARANPSLVGRCVLDKSNQTETAGLRYDGSVVSFPDINGPSAQSIRAFAGALWQCIRALGFTVCLPAKTLPKLVAVGPQLHPLTSFHTSVQASQN